MHGGKAQARPAPSDRGSLGPLSTGPGHARAGPKRRALDRAARPQGACPKYRHGRAEQPSRHTRRVGRLDASYALSIMGIHRDDPVGFLVLDCITSSGHAHADARSAF
jgi:hypothetical protein